MRGKYKSKKMLFFIVLLFVIIQIVTIVGLARETNEEPTDTSNDIQIINSLDNLVTLERIMSLVSNDQEDLEETTPQELVLKIEPVELDREQNSESGTEEVNSDTVTTVETINSDSTGPSTTTSPSGNSGSSSSSASTNTPPPTNSVDSDSDISTNEKEEPEFELDANTFLHGQEYAIFTFAAKKPALTIKFLNDALPGQKLMMQVTSEGIPVKDVKVQFIGSYLTDENGVAVIEIPKLEVGTKLPASVEKEEFEPTSQWIEIIKPKYGAPYIAQLYDKEFTLSSIPNTWNSILNRLSFQTGN